MAKDYLTGKFIHVIFPLDVTLYPHSEFSEYYEIAPETLSIKIENLPKKKTKHDILSRNRELNAERRRKLNLKGEQ